MRWPFGLVAAFLLHLSLYPWRFQASHLNSDPLSMLLFRPLRHPGDVMDIIVNAFMYLPLGWTGWWALTRPASPLWRAALLVAGAFLFSLTLELIQFYVPGRYTNLADVAGNTLGAMAGVALGAVTRHWPARFPPWWRKSFTGAGGIWLLAAWLGWQCFPFLPVLRWGKLGAAGWQWWTPSSAIELTETALGCFLIPWLALLILRHDHPAASRRAARWSAVAAGLCLPLRAFVIGSLSAHADAVAAGWTGALFGALSLPRGAAWPAPAVCRAAGAVLCVWLAFRQLMPFAFTPDATAFHWIPFAVSIEAPRDASVRILLGKFFFAGVAIAALTLGRTRAFPATLLVAGVLASGEWLQRYLPDRVPESTDPVLALCAGWLCFRRTGSGRE